MIVTRQRRRKNYIYAKCSLRLSVLGLRLRLIMIEKLLALNYTLKLLKWTKILIFKAPKAPPKLF